MRPGDIVLDYGCATGADVLSLAEKVGSDGKIVAIDISIKQLERSVKKAKSLPGHPNVVFVKEEKELMPFDGATFDRIISVGVLSYQDDPGELLKEFRRVLRNGGRLSILDFGRALFVPKAKYLKSTESIKKAFNSAGFKEISVEKASSFSAEYYYITAVK